ncbi:MAG TPA: TonB-dependent receptor [Holophagaceae bacterium]|nr:TonB-dependent receptor [Holophagaceae bacterium]
MNRLHRRLGLGLLLAAAPAFAQTTTTGSISGTVTGPEGAPVAGATVSLSSAQVTRTVVTGADGGFRVGLLNPGSWQIRIVKEGLQTATQAVTVSTNENRNVNFKLATENQTVVITASSVDVTSTQTGLSLSQEKMAALPKGRDFTDLALFTPGVVDGSGGGPGFGFGSLTKSPSISGASSAENSFIVDGLQSTDFRYGGQGSSLKTDFVDQVEIQTGGYKPEYSALGGVFNAILKSGSNDFKGSAWVTWDPIGIHATAKDNLYFTAAKPDARYDVGAEMGGAIVKDKLFYWFGLDANISESPGSEPNNDPGLLSDKAKTQELNFVGKLNWFLAQDQQLTVSLSYNPSTNKQDLLYPNTGTANFGSEFKHTQTGVSLNYDWNITQSLFLSLKAGYNQIKDLTTPKDISTPVVDYAWYSSGLNNGYYNATYPGNAGVGPGGIANPSLLDSGLPYTRGGFGLITQNEQNGTSKQFRADLSWFIGSHNLKFGASYLANDYLRRFDAGNFFTISGDASYLNNIIQSSDSTVKATFMAYYAQDTWEIGSGFRAFYGLRFETQEQKDAQGHTFLKFDNFKDYAQPRLGFTWDLNNDGKAKLSGSYGVYFEAIPQRLATRVFGNEVLKSYYFFDPKFQYDPNAANHYGNVVGGLGDANSDFTLDFGTPFSYDPIAENTKLPQRQEYTLGFDYTLPNGIVAGIHGKHRVLKNVIEDSVITDALGNPADPGVPYDQFGDTAGQAILWNPGNYAAWTSRNIDVQPNQRFAVNGTGFDKAGNTYNSVDLTLSGKSDHATWDFSYTWSRLEGNYEGVVSSSNGQPDGNITASFDYFPYVGYGLLPLDRTHVVKFFGSYRWDFGKNALNAGYNWTFQSGTPISLLDDGSTSHGQAPGTDTRNNTTTGGAPGAGVVVLPDGTTYNSLDIGGYGNAVFADGKQGQFGRTPSLNTVDVHLDFQWVLGPKLRLSPSIDMFNVFNTRRATGLFQLATDGNGIAQPSYGEANGYQEGRRYRFGVKLQF